MLARLLVLTLPGVLLVQCAPAEPAAELPVAIVQGGAEPVVHSRKEMQSAVASWAAKAQNPVEFCLAPALRSQWKELISESIWGEYARRCTAKVMGSGHVSIQLEYRDYVRLRAALHQPEIRAGLTSKDQRVLQQLGDCVKKTIQPGMTSFDKLVALHDALVQMARYDADAGGDICDILSKGCGSCEAYSSALCVMLELAGIPSRVVTGTADGPHAWNLVKLGSEWYHVDATWDDPVVGNGSRQVVAHGFCGVSDSEMARTHHWSRDAYPASGTRTAYYYRQRGVYFTSVGAYWQAAQAAYRRGEKNFEGYLTSYETPADFQKEVQRYVNADGPARLSWSGPDAGAGPVIVTFAFD